MTTRYRDSDRAATRGRDAARAGREKRRKINEGGISRGTYEIVVSIILGWIRLNRGNRWDLSGKENEIIVTIILLACLTDCLND